MISVIIWVYNVEDYVYICINSILKQTYQNFEIICIDDASTDSSSDILKYFAKKDQRVQIIKNKTHKGLNHSRNEGINKANGEYILFLNGYDWHSLNSLENLIQNAKNNDVDVVLFKNAILYDNNQNFRLQQSYDINFLNEFNGKIFNHWDLDKSMLFHLPTDACTKLYSKSFLYENNIRFSNENQAKEDLSFYYKIITSAHKIYFIDKHFYNKHAKSNNEIKFNQNDLFDEIPIVYSILDVFLKNKKIYDYYKKQVLNYIFDKTLNRKFNQLENKYKEKFFLEIQCVFKSCIEEYGLYLDILENVDQDILRNFKFKELVNEILINSDGLSNDIDVVNYKNSENQSINKNEIFTLWIPDNEEKKLPLLAFLSLKSMILCGHDVILYTYDYLENVPDNVKVVDANEIIDQSKIFRYKTGHKTFSGFANLFRLKRLYEFGGTWLDLDILLIRNINEKFNEDTIIVSEPTRQIYLHPNNAILRFQKHDPLVKEMLDFAEERGDDVVHGETGPKLVSKMLKTSFKKYNIYLKHFNFNNILKWNDIQDYSKNPNELLNNINMDEVIGFHLFNTFFKKIIDSFDSDSFFSILKRIILYSESKEDYELYLKKYNILKSNKSNLIKNSDMRYLKMLKKDNNYTYTILIDAKNLKKVEIYNILHSIGNDESYTLQIFVFSKSTIPKDKVKLGANFNAFASGFNELSKELVDYIKGTYIIPINKALMFNLEFFKNKEITCDVEHYILNNPDSYLNIFSKNSFKMLIENDMDDIFNLSKESMSKFCFEIKTIEGNLIYDYYNRTDVANTLMKLIDYLKDNPQMFAYIKTKLLNLKFKNLINEVSYYYYINYNNIVTSNSYLEFKLKEEKADLDFLNSFYLNKLDDNYEI